MHPSALKTGRAFFEAYLAHRSEVRVIDLGSQDVNGSLKSVCPENFNYTGVDFVAGNGVDIVLQDPYVLPFDSDSIDAIVCSSVFEHSEFFWLLFLEAMRVLKPSGLLYLNVPANGEFHRYPVDCWRFYPDAGDALVRWAERNNISAVLLESFVGEQDRDQWNDFVAVILKDRQHAVDYPKRILDHKQDFTNGKVYEAPDDFRQRRDAPEDRARILEVRRILTEPLVISRPEPNPVKVGEEDQSHSTSNAEAHGIIKSSIVGTRHAQGVSIMNDMFESARQEHLAVFSALESLGSRVEQIAGVLADCLRAGGKIMLCGNGGSAADSQHIAAELTGRFINDRAPLAGLALSTDSSALTCIGNDYGFADIFERQVRGLGKPGDCLIGISTSGNSENVIRAVNSANAMGITSIGLLGRDGGKLAALCAHQITVPSDTTARIQEAHIFIGHLWCAGIEAKLLKP